MGALQIGVESTSNEAVGETEGNNTQWRDPQD